MESVKNNLKKVLNRLKVVFSKLIILMIIVSGTLSGFYYGMYYNKLNSPKPKMIKSYKIVRGDVTLAIDEHNRLIIINNENGGYSIYDEKIGNSIFKLYAHKLWSENKN